MLLSMYHIIISYPAILIKYFHIGSFMMHVLYSLISDQRIIEDIWKKKKHWLLADSKGEIVFKLFLTLVKFKAKENFKGYQTQFNIQFESLNMKVIKWKSRNLLSHLYSLIPPERHTKSPTWFCLIKAADSFILSCPIWKLPLPQS